MVRGVADRAFLPAKSLLEEVGDRGWLCTACAKLGYTYYRLGRLDEADAQAVRSAEMGTPDDVANEAQWREVRARVLARRGERTGGGVER